MHGEISRFFSPRLIKMIPVSSSLLGIILRDGWCVKRPLLAITNCFRNEKLSVAGQKNIIAY